MKNKKLYPLKDIIPIIIINWNGLDDTVECIQSVLKLQNVDFKIYLVDNGSDNDEMGKLKTIFANVPVIEFIQYNVNHGFTKASNLVLDIILQLEVVPEYIAMLNNDTTVDPSWLAALYQTARKYGASMIASKMIQYNNRNFLDNVGHRMINTAEVVPIGHKENVENYTSDLRNFGACAGASLYSSEMLRDIGLFDEYFNTGYEDAELGMRAITAGYESVFSANAIVYHKISQSVGKIFNEAYLTRIQKNIYYSYLKVMPLCVIVVSFPFLVIKYALVIISHALFYKRRHIRTHINAIKEVKKDIPFIKKQRSQFLAGRKTASCFSILRRQTFFLGFDIKRFWNYIIKKKSSDFDKVNPKKV